MADRDAAPTEARSRAPRSLFLAATLLAVGLIVLVRLLPKGPPPEAQAPPPVPVRVETVRPVPEMPDDFELPAGVEANRVVRVSAEVAGRVRRLPPGEGALVRKGAVLAELDTDLLKAEFDRAEAVAKHATLEHARVVRLQKQGAATAREMDAAAAALATSEAALRLARVRLARGRITAPIGGVLDELLVEEGEYVRAGDGVARLVEIDTVKVVARVPELDVPFLKIGDAVEVFTGMGKDAKASTGAISYISEIADEGTRSTRVEVALDNRKRLLRSGRIVRVRLVRRVLKDVVLVPLAAVIPLEAGKAVYVAENGKAVRLSVRVNTRFIRTVDGMPRIQVLPGPEGSGRGLRPGDRLIVAGQQLVAPGQRVEIMNEAAGGGGTQP